MDFGLAFSFPFKDPQWFKKLIIPGLLSLIPLVGQFFLMGYCLNVAKRVIEKNPEELPDLDFGEDLKRGFMAFVITLGYSLPLIVLALIFGIINVAVVGLSSNGDSDLASIISVIMTFGFGSISFIYGIAMAFFIYPAYGNYLAKNEQLSAAFRINEIWGLIKSAWVAYLLVLVGGIVASLLGGLGSIICIVGLLVTMPYAMAVYGHLIGQAYNQAVAVQET